MENEEHACYFISSKLLKTLPSSRFKFRESEGQDSAGCDKQLRETMDESDWLREIRQLSRSNSQGETSGQIIARTSTKRADPSPKEENVKTEKYRECQKNHAAAIGGNTRDGCREFMPTGEEGTPEALKCAACNCHRNFHRKETIRFHPFPLNCSRYGENDINSSTTRTIIIGNRMGDGKMDAGRETKKRFRTKFTPEQKERLLAVAEKAEWTIHKLEESEVQKFCLETGIKKRVLKVWIHNNKSSREKRKSNTSSG